MGDSAHHRLPINMRRWSELFEISGRCKCIANPTDDLSASLPFRLLLRHLVSTHHVGCQKLAPVTPVPPFKGDTKTVAPGLGKVSLSKGKRVTPCLGSPDSRGSCLVHPCPRRISRRVLAPDPMGLGNPSGFPCPVKITPRRAARMLPVDPRAGLDAFF